MITFLPYADFALSAAVLDRQRLGKQRLEVLQILRMIKTGRHPACVMWRGFEGALVAYGLAVCREWIDRGYDDSTRQKILAFGGGDRSLPRWIGNEAFHASHRGNLLRKDPEWYGTFGWTDSPLLPYVWPRNVDPRL